MHTLVVRKRLLVRRDRVDGAYTEQLRTALPCMVALAPDGREMVARGDDGEENVHVLRRLRGVVEWRPPVRITCPHPPSWRVERLVWDPVSGTLAIRGTAGGDNAPRMRARGWMDPASPGAGAVCTAGVGVLAARTLGWGTRSISTLSIPTPEATGNGPPTAEDALRVHWAPGAVLVRLPVGADDGASVLVGYEERAAGVRLCPLYAPTCDSGGGMRTVGVRDMLEHHALVDMCEGTDRRVGKVVVQNGRRRCVVVRVSWWDGVAHCTCVPLDGSDHETVGVVIGVGGWVAAQGETPRRIAASPVHMPSAFTDVHTGGRYRAAGVFRVRGYPIYILHTTKGGVRLVAAHELVSGYRKEERVWKERISTTGKTVDRMLRASGAYPLTHPVHQLVSATASRGTIRLTGADRVTFHVRGVRGCAYWQSIYTLPDTHTKGRRVLEASRILPYVQKRKRTRSAWSRTDVRSDAHFVVYSRDSVTDRMLTLFHELKTQMWNDEQVGVEMRTDLTRYVDRVMHWVETTGWFAKVALVPDTLLLFDNVVCAHLPKGAVAHLPKGAVNWEGAAQTHRTEDEDDPARQYADRVFDLLLVSGPLFDTVTVRTFPGRDTMTLSEWAHLARRSHPPKRRYIPMLAPPRSLVDVVKRRRKDPVPRRRSRMGVRLDTATAIRRVAVVHADDKRTPTADEGGLWCAERSSTTASPTGALMVSVRADVFRRASVRAHDGVVLRAERSGVCRFQRLGTHAREALGVDLATDAFRLDDASPIVLTIWDSVEDARSSAVRKWQALESTEPRRRLVERVDATWAAPSDGSSERLRRALTRAGVDGCDDTVRVVTEELPVTYPLNMDRMLVALARATGVPLRVDDATRPSRLRSFHTDTSMGRDAARFDEQDMLLVEDGEVTATDRVVDDRRGNAVLKGVGYYRIEEDGERRVGFGWCVRDDNDGVWRDYAPWSTVRRITTDAEERAMRTMWSRWGEVFLYT